MAAWRGAPGSWKSSWRNASEPRAELQTTHAELENRVREPHPCAGNAQRGAEPSAAGTGSREPAPPPPGRRRPAHRHRQPPPFRSDSRSRSAPSASRTAAAVLDLPRASTNSSTSTTPTGHAHGDEGLRRVARTLDESFRRRRRSGRSITAAKNSRWSCPAWMRTAPACMRNVCAAGSGGWPFPAAPGESSERITISGGVAAIAPGTSGFAIQRPMHCYGPPTRRSTRPNARDGTGSPWPMHQQRDQRPSEPDRRARVLTLLPWPRLLHPRGGRRIVDSSHSSSITTDYKECGSRAICISFGRENRMTDKKTVGGVTYQNAGKDYFEKRGLTTSRESLVAMGAGRRRRDLGSFLRLEFRHRRRRLGRPVHRRHHHRHHVSGADLQPGGNVAGAASHRRRAIHSLAAPWGRGAASSPAWRRASNTS